MTHDNLLLRNLASIIPRQFPICSDCSPPTVENLDARTEAFVIRVSATSLD
eukprot:gene4598-5042_t